MRAISATVDIAATPEQVWAVLADLPAYQEWNPFIRSASGQLAEGATLTLRMAPANGRAMTFRPKVLAAQPGVLLRWIGRLIRSEERRAGKARRTLAPPARAAGIAARPER